MESIKKFEIIEEGRLNKSEMNQVIGGVLVCTSGYVVSNCTRQLASCPETYVSCGSSGDNNWSCTSTNAPYSGEPFGGGYSSGVKYDPILNPVNEALYPVYAGPIEMQKTYI